MPKGTLKTFDPAKGFGTLLLETGEELPFDISASNKREPQLGAVAEVTVGTGYSGRPKAKLVLFELEEHRAPSFATGLKQLQKLGFLLEWDTRQAKAAAKELFDEVPAKFLRTQVGGLLQHYYGEGLSERGRAEGVITLDWRVRQVTEHPVEDLLSLCSDGGGVVIDGLLRNLAHEGLPSLLDGLNAALAKAGSQQRFFTLDFDSDYFVIACRNLGFDADVRTTSFLKLG